MSERTLNAEQLKNLIKNGDVERIGVPYCEGKDVQVLSGSEWMSEISVFNFGSPSGFYRVKPETVKLEVVVFRYAGPFSRASARPWIE